MSTNPTACCQKSNNRAIQCHVRYRIIYKFCGSVNYDDKSNCILGVIVITMVITFITMVFLITIVVIYITIVITLITMVLLIITTVLIMTIVFLITMVIIFVMGILDGDDDITTIITGSNAVKLTTKPPRFHNCLVSNINNTIHDNSPSYLR